MNNGLRGADGWGLELPGWFENPLRQPGQDAACLRLDIVAQAPGVLAGMESALAIAAAMGLRGDTTGVDSAPYAIGDCLLSLRGESWRFASRWQDVLDVLARASGIASATAAMLNIVAATRPGVVLALRRRSTPGAALRTRAALCGGAVPDPGGSRALVRIDAGEDLALRVDQIRRGSRPQLVLARAAGLDEAKAALAAGVDGVEFDCLGAAALADAAAVLRKLRPGLLIHACGEINLDTIAAYAASGADVLLTNSMDKAPAADFGIALHLEPALQ